MKRLLFLSALLLTLPSPAAAHPVPFSFIDVQTNATGIELSLVIHDFDLAHDLGIVAAEQLLDPVFLAMHAASIRDLLGTRLQISADGRQLTPEWSDPEILKDRQSVRFLLRYPSGASLPGIVSLKAAMFPYDPEHQTFVNLYENGELTRQAILNRTDRSVVFQTGDRQSATAVIRKFIPEGIHHILIGPDHILFLMGLLLLGGSPRRLMLVVTAFTVAHSITLSIAALGLFRPPPQIIEAAIALSIVYVGFDNLLVRKGRDVRAWIAFGFGFVHGFGFANVLGEMDLPRKALGWSLFSFNFGVEIGQLIVVLIVASILAVIRSRSEKLAHHVAVVGSFAVIAAGTYWFVQRVFFPSGLG